MKNNDGPMKEIAWTLLAFTPVLCSSCVGVNAVVNLQQEVRLNQVDGRLHILECRDIRATERAQGLMARDGFELQVDLMDLGVRRGLKSGWRITDVECVLFPRDDAWTSFLAIASGKESWSLLFWQCSADLYRLGIPEAGVSTVDFAAVPPGDYSLVVRFKLIDGSRTRVGRPWPTRIADLTVTEDGVLDAAPMRQVDLEATQQLSKKM
ncbi:hypothetical protein N9Z54_06685 [Planctomycetota bacterium]|nr:hypothetical protein [Planctomycetota bacterium]